MTFSTRVSRIFQILTLSLLIAAFASSTAFAFDGDDDRAIPITACGTVISQHGHYVLTADLVCGGPTAPVTRTAPVMPTSDTLAAASSMIAPHPPASSPDGIDIIADHVDLMLNGHTISGGSNANNVGINVGASAITGAGAGNSHVHIVGPGTIAGFGIGIGFVAVSHSAVKDVTVTDALAAFIVLGGNCTPPVVCTSTKNNLQGNSAAFAEFGFILLGADDNTVRDNDVTNTGAGIVVDGVDNDVRQNNASGNIIGIVAGFIFAGATDNDFTHNTALNNVEIDLADANGNCTANTWKHNTFGAADPPCIR